jgi:Tfp pilus assembly major pilin PilA
MLKAINTKILLAILAALTAIGGALTYQRHEAAKAAAAATKSAAILQQQQKEAEERKAENEAFQRRVEADKRKHNSAAANEGKTWQKYIP